MTRRRRRCSRCGRGAPSSSAAGRPWTAGTRRSGWSSGRHPSPRGFMRSSSLSRVMAALFTRIVGMPSAPSSSASSASIDAASAAFQHRPPALQPLRRRTVRSAPSPLPRWWTCRRLVAPACASPRAMALPMPREAPVTRARSFSSMVNLVGKGSAKL